MQQQLKLCMWMNSAELYGYESTLCTVCRVDLQLFFLFRRWVGGWHPLHPQYGSCCAMNIYHRRRSHRVYVVLPGTHTHMESINMYSVRVFSLVM